MGASQRAYAFGEHRLGYLLDVYRSHRRAMDTMEDGAEKTSESVGADIVATDIVDLLFGDSPEGTRLDGMYVVINGTGDSARAEMVRMFGPVWSMQYSSRDLAGVEEFGLSELHVLKDWAPAGGVS